MPTGTDAPRAAAAARSAGGQERDRGDRPARHSAVRRVRRRRVAEPGDGRHRLAPPRHHPGSGRAGRRCGEPHALVGRRGSPELPGRPGRARRPRLRLVRRHPRRRRQPVPARPVRLRPALPSRRRHTAFLAGVPAAVLLAVATDPWHHLVFSRIVPLDRFPWFRDEFGPLFWVHTAWCYLVLGLAFRRLAVAWWHGSAVLRRQLGLLLVAGSSRWPGTSWCWPVPRRCPGAT